MISLLALASTAGRSLALRTPAGRIALRPATRPVRLHATETPRAWRGQPLWDYNLETTEDDGGAALEALHAAGAWDVVVDARSESEFALDHVPGAINRPVLSDAERVEVGTMYKADPFEARRRGGAGGGQPGVDLGWEAEGGAVSD